MMVTGSYWGGATETTSTGTDTFYRVPIYRYGHKWEHEERSSRKEEPKNKEEQWLRSRVSEICELVELK